MRLTTPAWGLLAGLTPLVPLPLVDFWLAARMRRQMYREIARDLAIEVDRDTLVALTRRRQGLLSRVAGGIVFWVIRKIFRTILYFLTVKDVFDESSDALLRASMFRAALERGWLPSRVEEVRSAMDEILKRSSPVERLLLGQPSGTPDDFGGGLIGGLGSGLQRYGGGAILVAEFERRMTATEAADAAATGDGVQGPASDG